MIIIRWKEKLLVTHQSDILILIGHKKKSPIVQDHTVYMLQGKKINSLKIQ